MESLIPISSALLQAITATIVEARRHGNFKEEKYWEKQIEFYTKVWPILLSLKRRADFLWMKATEKGLLDFVFVLEETEKILNENKLIIDDDHFTDLTELIHHFWQFHVGKLRLIDLRGNISLKDISTYQLFLDRENIFITRNRTIKNRYDEKLIQIEMQFKEKLREKGVKGLGKFLDHNNDAQK